MRLNSVIFDSIMTSGPLICRYLAEFRRFLVVGLMAAFINTVIIILLTEVFNINYLLSYGICFLIVTIFGFLLNHMWTFRLGKWTEWHRLFRYNFVAILATICAMVISRVLVGHNMPYYYAVFVAACVVAPLNFIAHRYFSFGFNMGCK